MRTITFAHGDDASVSGNVSQNATAGTFRDFSVGTIWNQRTFKSRNVPAAAFCDTSPLTKASSPRGKFYRSHIFAENLIIIMSSRPRLSHL